MLVEMTNAEAETLLRLLDVSIKALGLQGAQAAMPIVDKITSAATAEVKRGDEDA